ncbi:MAG: NAD-dependent deacylase [Chloroflexi bacterium]|jgi:NAD-dependent deacetylase|nr:NAD-dependent deacylase [Chloroflexota bacterium]
MNIPLPEALIQALGQARAVAVLTGAGVSAESGVPTFREAQTGLWAEYRPEDLATPEAFHQNPQRVWDWYQWRRDLVAKVSPNPGHYALVEMESHITARGGIFTLITQNVDGLHHRAGSQNIHELHGNIQRIQCAQCGIEAQSGHTHGSPPCCLRPGCGGLLRPDVVWFGESLPQRALHIAIEAANTCEIFFSIGTSALVQPAASLPLMALESGALLVEINPEPTPLTPRADFALQGASGEILPELVEKIAR